MVISGDFSDSIGKYFNAYVGSTASDADAKALSGNPGQTGVKPISASAIQFYTPKLAPGKHSIYLLREDGLYEATAQNSVLVLPAQYSSTVLSVKNQYPPNLYVGARNLNTLPQTEAPTPPVPDAPVVTSPISDGDELVSGTSVDDLATIQILVNSVVVAETTVFDGAWWTAIPVVSTGDSVTAIASNLVGAGPSSTPVVVTP
jgi:hypothetical protein